MEKKYIPKSLLLELKEKGYSDEMIRESYKWFDSSKHKGVASF